MTHKILIIARSAPYGSSLAKEGLDYVLTSAAYDQEICLLFSGDGLFQLLKQQEPRGIHLKSQLAAMEILPLYDIENLLAVEEDLIERNIQSDQLGVKVRLIKRAEVGQLIHAHHKVISF
ncbi:MAG: sulfurtransferase complex subunit TusC [Bermanella sp.]